MKKIPLSRGFFALVDDEDYTFLMQWRWSLNEKRKNLSAYRRCYKGAKRFVSMHRLILGVTDAKTFVDHKDGNGLNNQKNNLRLCTNSENLRNRGMNKNNTSGFKGVVWAKWANKWLSQITHNGKCIKCGYFAEKVDAAHAYNEAAKLYHGEFANLNTIR